MLDMARELFDLVLASKIKSEPSRQFKLEEAAQAHQALESRKTTVPSSLDSLSRRGLLVCFGTASGPIPPIDAMQLAVKGSLFVTRPALADYIADPDERAELAGELFGHIGAGRIEVAVNQRYALDDAVHAHRDLESGRSVGSSVFVLES